jgi:hypothetical protein
MGRLACRDAVALRLREVADRAAILKLRGERAAGVQRIRVFREIEKLARCKQLLEKRLDVLEQEEDGLWEDIKAEVRAVLADLPGGVERWIERLDENHATHAREACEQPAAVPGSRRTGRAIREALRLEVE